MALTALFMALFGEKLISKDCEIPTEEALAGKTSVGIYFSAHWCSPCRDFTPKLAEMYKDAFKSKGMEIVFVSGDRDDSAFGEYFSEMPWLALPFSAKEQNDALNKKYKVKGMPSLVILGPDGNTITLDGQDAVMGDLEGARYPWIPPATEETAKIVLETLGSELLEKTGASEWEEWQKYDKQQWEASHWQDWHNARTAHNAEWGRDVSSSSHSKDPAVQSPMPQRAWEEAAALPKEDAFAPPTEESQLSQVMLGTPGLSDGAAAPTAEAVAAAPVEDGGTAALQAPSTSAQQQLMACQEFSNSVRCKVVLKSGDFAGQMCGKVNCGRHKRVKMAESEADVDMGILLDAGQVPTAAVDTESKADDRMDLQGRSAPDAVQCSYVYQRGKHKGKVCAKFNCRRRGHDDVSMYVAFCKESGASEGEPSLAASRKRSAVQGDGSSDVCTHFFRSGLNAGEQCGVKGCKKKGHSVLREAFDKPNTKGVQTHLARDSFAKYTWATDEQPQASGISQRAVLVLQMKQLRWQMKKYGGSDPRLAKAKDLLAIMTDKLRESVAREGRFGQYASALDKAAVEATEADYAATANLDKFKKIGRSMLKILHRFACVQQEMERNHQLAYRAAKRAVDTGGRLLVGSPDPRLPKKRRKLAVTDVTDYSAGSQPCCGCFSAGKLHCDCEMVAGTHPINCECDECLFNQCYADLVLTDGEDEQTDDAAA